MEKIKKLRKIISFFNIDGYIIPKNDEFFNEYVSDYNDDLKYISNFSGSYGFSIITKNKNYLFVDGRYTIQANQQSGREFKILNIPKKLPGTLFKKKNFRIGFCSKLFTKSTLEKLFSGSKCNLIPFDINLVDKIKKRKSFNSKKNIYQISNLYSGHECKKKVAIVSNKLKKNKKDLAFISAPENVAWLLNIRGNDSNYSPIANCRVIISADKKIFLFIDKKKVSPKLKFKVKYLKIIEPDHLKNFILSIKNKKVCIDKSTSSIYFENLFKKNNQIFKGEDFIYLLKSVKNQVEIDQIKKAHIYDGVALTKFIFWLKDNFRKFPISEIAAEKKLLSFRKRNRRFKFLSFPTISSTGSNGAIVHYRATPETNKVLKKGNLYLVDSGGQYYYGTTDVTRTLSLDNKNYRIKNIYTRVLKGHIAVAKFKIKNNTLGFHIDKVARKYLNQMKLDYNHGTGHGVGYFLNVHEGPQAISKFNKNTFKKGMILSNEPGYYEKNKFGIRIENLVSVVKKKKHLNFENLTMAPIEKDLIDKKLMRKDEIKWLNNYHKKVYLNLHKFMNSREKRS